jgi:uncharacterized glyoxalase superfamily protein PhnB
MTMVSFMLSVNDAAEASSWYQRALGASEIWSLGSVRALDFEGVCLVLHEAAEKFPTPVAAGGTTVRLEIFADDPDSIVSRAVESGADGSRDSIQDYETPWGPHRQGGFTDPFGHVWLVGDMSPLGWRGSIDG